MICANSVPQWAIGDWRQFPKAKILYLLHGVLRGIQECLAATSRPYPVSYDCGPTQLSSARVEARCDSLGPQQLDAPLSIRPLTPQIRLPELPDRATSNADPSS